MKKLRIAMYFSSDPSAFGGVQESVYYLALCLRKLGHYVRIFGPATSKRFHNYRRLGRLIPVPMPNGNWSSLNLWTQNEERPSFIINKGGYDICHIHEPYTPFIAWELIRNVAIPKISTFYLSWDDDSIANIIKPFLPIMRRDFSSRVGGVIYISAIAKRRWQKLCSTKVMQKLILSGLDHESFSPVKKRTLNGRLRILFLARLVSKKGLLYLLEAVLELRKEFPDLLLNVVGDGADRKRFENFVQAHHLKRNVIFAGAVNDRKRREFYQQADIFCAPYVDEGYGLTVIEAMACGCPIVGFKNEAFHETLNGYPNSELLVKSRDSEALAKALRALIINPALRKKLGAWGIKTSKKYNWDAIARETEHFYFQILNRSRTRAKSV